MRQYNETDRKEEPCRQYCHWVWEEWGCFDWCFHHKGLAQGGTCTWLNVCCRFLDQGMRFVALLFGVVCVRAVVVEAGLQLSWCWMTWKRWTGQKMWTIIRKVHRLGSIVRECCAQRMFGSLDEDTIRICTLVEVA